MRKANRRKHSDNEFDVEIKRRFEKIYVSSYEIADAFSDLYAKKEMVSMFDEKDSCYKEMKEEYGAYKRMLIGLMQEFDENVKEYNNYFQQHQNDLYTTKGYGYSFFKNSNDLLTKIISGIIAE